jgi:hypothetical protein
MRSSLPFAFLALLTACGDDGRATASAGATLSGGTTGTASTDGTTAPTTGGTTGAGATDGATGGAATTAADTGPETTSTTTGTTAVGDTTGSTGGTTGPVACEDMQELCDALDNNCNGLYDEGCDCTPPDLDLTAIDGYTARVIVDVTKDVGNYVYLADVERAAGLYWSDPGEGVLFTVNDGSNTAGGIGIIDQDGGFKGWLVDPAAKTLPINPYLEYAYGGLLYACSTVGGNWIYKIHPDGTVEQVVQHGECEGLIYGDRGDGVERLYASNYTNATIAMIGEDNSRTVVVTDPLKLPIIVDLAIPPTDSAFPPGLYGINQTMLGVHRLDPKGALTLDFPYTAGWGVGEELSFAAPTSAFRDHFYHLSASLNAVVRVKPDGTWEKVITGPKLNYGLYSTGGVFSSNGAYYFFTNEDSLIMRLQACNAAGQ